MSARDNNYSDRKYFLLRADHEIESTFAQSIFLRKAYFGTQETLHNKKLSLRDGSLHGKARLCCLN